MNKKVKEVIGLRLGAGVTMPWFLFQYVTMIGGIKQ